MRLFRESIDLLGECRDTAMTTAKSDALQYAMPSLRSASPCERPCTQQHSGARLAAGNRVACGSVEPEDWMAFERHRIAAPATKRRTQKMSL